MFKGQIQALSQSISNNHNMPLPIAQELSNVSHYHLTSSSQDLLPWFEPKIGYQTTSTEALQKLSSLEQSTNSSVSKSSQINHFDDLVARRIERTDIQKGMKGKHRAQYRMCPAGKLRMLPVQFVHHVNREAHQLDKQRHL